MRSQCSTKMWTSKQEGPEISDLTGRKVSYRYQEGKGKAKLHVHDTCMPTPLAPEYGADWIAHMHDTRIPTPSAPEYGQTG